MTCRHYHQRPTPTVDEHSHAAALARYLGHGLHPCIAVILAYEDATNSHQKTSSGAPNETTPNPRTHIQPRQPHLPT